MALTELRERRPTTEITLRPAKTQDVAQIFELANTRMFDVAPPQYGARLSPFYRKSLAEQKKIMQRIHGYIEGNKTSPEQNFATVATTPIPLTDGEATEQVVGFMFGARDTTKNECKIVDLIVDKTHEGQGVGSALENHYTQWVRSFDASSIIVIASTNNLARDFVENRGYRPYYKLDRLETPDHVVGEEIVFSLTPERPPWHEPPTGMQPSRIIDTFTENFMVARAVTLREGGNKRNVREFEAASYDVLAYPDQQLAGGDFLPITRHDELIGLRDASLPEDYFITTLMEQRAASFPVLRRVAKTLDRQQVVGKASGLINLPAILINIDEPEHLRNLGIPPETITAALKEAPNWSASEHMFLFSKQDASHDYRRYAHEMSRELGLTLDEFLYRQQIHEGVHPWIDHFTDSFFSEYATWFNEGVCDFYAGFEARARYRLMQSGTRGAISIEDVMTSTDRNLLAGGGYFLVKAIELDMVPPESTSNLSGIAWFMNGLIHNNRLNLPLRRRPLNGQTLNERVMATLKANGSYSTVKEIFEKEVEGL